MARPAPAPPKAVLAPVVPERPLLVLERLRTLPEAERIEEAANEIHEKYATATGALLRIGQLIVVACYDADEKAASADDKDANRLFLKLTTRLGTLGSGISAKTLSTARRIAAANKLVNSHHWPIVPYGYKEELVRLKDAKRLGVGAKAAVDAGLTRKGIAAWVDAENARVGHVKAPRGRSLGSTRTSAKKLVAAGTAKSLERQVKDFARLSAKEQREALVDVEQARETLDLLLKKLRSGK